LRPLAEGPGRTGSEVIALFRVINRYIGKLPPMPGVFPDYPAPVCTTPAARQPLK
jgi:hypothetical protein